MAAPPPRSSRSPLRAFVAATARAFTHAELVALSSDASVSRAVASGELCRLLPGVYATSVHAQAFYTRADAALRWAGPDAAIAGCGALFLWGMLREPPDQVEIVVPQAFRRRGTEWLRIRRLTTPVPTRDAGPLVVVSPAHAVVHGYGRVAHRYRADVVYRAVRSHITTTREIQRAMAATAQVRARRSLERRLAAAERGAESYLEERALHKVFNTDEFARLICQHDVVIEGCAYRLDLYDDATRTAIELDSEEHHGRTPDRQRDVNRDAHLATIGIQTLRFTYRDIMERPGWCREMARSTMATRATRR